MKKWKKLIAGFCVASMFMTMPGVSAYAAEPTDAEFVEISEEIPDDAQNTESITEEVVDAAEEEIVTETVDVSVDDVAPAEILEDPAEYAELAEEDAPSPETQEDVAETADWALEHTSPEEETLTGATAEPNVYRVGDGVTATYDVDTGSIIFKTTTGGTLWKDWIEKTGINRGRILSIANQPYSGGDSSKWQVKLPADSSFIFSGLSALTTLNLWGLDTSNVINMSYMFYDCRSLKSLDLSCIKTPNVTDMSCMLDNCLALAKLNIKGLDTSNVTNMSSMFYKCKSLTTLALSGLKTSNVTDMSDMFLQCESLASLYMTNLDARKVKDMSYMFCGCKSLTTLDFRDFEAENVTNVSYMFNGCEKLEYLDLYKLKIRNVNNAKNMFTGCKALNVLITPNINGSSYKIDLPHFMYDRTGLRFNQMPLNNFSVVLGKTPTLASSVFSDVRTPTNPYYNAIYWAAKKGITKGYINGTFGINRDCTRGEMIMFLWRYAGKPAPKNVAISPFRDVPKSHTFYKAILWAYQKKITKGYGNGIFGINRKVTRGESMMFLWRLKGKPKPKAVSVSPFKDVPKNHVFYNAIIWGYQKKITTGYTGAKDGMFGPKDNCTRGQIVTFLYRARNL